MTIAPSLDPSWTTATSGAALASAAFSPVANSLVIACACADSGTGAIGCTFTNSAGLSFTPIGTVQVGTSGGAVATAWAFDTAGHAGMTITATWTGTGTSGSKGTKPVTFTGTASVSPIGTPVQANSATNNFTSSFTNTVDQSLGFGVATEWNAMGLPVSTDLEVAFHLTAVDGISVFKAAPTSGTGVSVGLNFDAGGTGAAVWSTIVFEIKPAAGGAGKSLLLPDYRAKRHLIAR